MVPTNKYELYMESEYEKIADEYFIEMSDGAKLRILRTSAQSETKEPYTLIIIAGWGSVILGWDEVLMDVSRDFNVIYMETREKGSSVLPKKFEKGMDRLAEDLKEVIEQLNLDQSKLILLGSCFGATLISYGLAKKKYSPFLSVIIGPPARFEMPPLTRYIIFLVPPFALKLFRPIAVFWIKKFKTEDPEQAAKYIRVLKEADGKKWKKVVQSLVLPWWWDIYAKIENKVLLIAAEEDKMHNAKDTQKIRELIKNADYLDLGSNKATHSQPLVNALRTYLKQMDKKN